MLKQTISLSYTLVSITAAMLLGVTTTYAADVKRGEELSQTCLGCHGAPGLRNPGPVYQIPMIGGQHASYIVSALQAYKSKERGHATMQAQAASLSEQDMADIAAFFASMSGNTRPSSVSATLAKKGKEEAAACAACHGANGDAATDMYPKLAGQYASYMAQSLKDYRSGDRKNPIMSGFAGSLNSEQIEALAAWFASQDGGLSAPQSKIFK